MILVELQYPIAFIAKLKVGQLLLIDAEHISIMLLLFLLLDFVDIKLVVKFEKAERLV